jgi:hypothetical protein
MKSHVRWGPCASHKALAHSQNTPFWILTLMLHLMILGAHPSEWEDWCLLMSKRNDTKSKQSQPNQRESKKKKASREIYQIYCSPPILEFWFNGVPLAYMTTNNHHNLRIWNPTLYTPHKILLMSTTKFAAVQSTQIRRVTMLLEQLPKTFWLRMESGMKGGRKKSYAQKNGQILIQSSSK